MRITFSYPQNHPRGKMAKTIPIPGNNYFNWILFCSIILHIAILSFVNITPSSNLKIEKLFEVQLEKIENQKQVRILPQKPQNYRNNKLTVPEKPTLQKINKAQNNLTINALSNYKNSNALLKGLNKPLPQIKPIAKPSLTIPISDNLNLIAPESEKDSILDHSVKLPESIKEQSELKIREQKVKSKTLTTGVNASQIEQGNTSGDIKTTELKQTSDNYKISSNHQSNEKQNPTTNPSIFSNLKIEGEVGNRKIIFQPKTPNLNINKDLTISVKISVLPNGVVDQVVPYRKADPDLEKLAIKLLLLYRFEPLFGENDVQYGIVHFTIKRSN